MKNKNVKRFELRLSERLYRLIKKAAEKDRRSMHNHLIFALERVYDYTRKYPEILSTYRSKGKRKDG